MARLGPPMSAAYSKDISPMPAKCLVTATFSPYLPGGAGCREGLSQTSRREQSDMAAVRLGNRKFRVPGTPIVRIVVGVILIIGGVFGFLPMLGFWMLPLGVVVLSVDLHPVRRFRRRVEVWWGRRRRRRRAERRAAPTRQLPSSVDPK